MMLHNFHEKIDNLLENHIEYYRNWCIDVIQDLDEKMTQSELAFFLCVCISKYGTYDKINEVTRLNFKHYAEHLSNILHDDEDLKKQFNTFLTDPDLHKKIPDTYTNQEIREIKLKRLLSEEK